MKKYIIQSFFSLIALGLITGCGGGTSDTLSSNSIVNIEIINEAPTFDASVLPDYAQAVEDQINNDVRSFWVGPKIHITIDTGPSDAWPVTLLDHNPNCGQEASGCHDIDKTPFATLNIVAGGSTLLSHEILEMWADSDINRCATIPNVGDALVEIVDPVAALYYIGTNGIPVNDFTTPAWWGIGNGKQMDFGNIVDIHPVGPGFIPIDNSPQHEPLGFITPGC